MLDRSERLDALITELHILVTLWNYQCWYAFEHPNVDFSAIWIRANQDDLAKLLKKVELRTVERVCARLEQLGRLQRKRSNPRAAFQYRVELAGLKLAISELALRVDFVQLVEYPEDRTMLVVLTYNGEGIIVGNDRDGVFS